MSFIFLRGGGDLASGVALRLFRSGLAPIILEIPQPLCVRRLVSFAQAVYDGATVVEGVRAERVTTPAEVQAVLANNAIPVVVDPPGELRRELPPLVWIDARLMKRPPELGLDTAPLVIGLGPGFTAGVDCHAVVETNRGHNLGRVYWQGAAEPNTGLPESVGPYRAERVLRAPAEGEFHALVELGAQVSAGQTLAEVAGQPVIAPFDGVLRGLIHSGLWVRRGLKIGDVDPRNEPGYARQVSDKAFSVGGGVLEAMLAQPPIRARLWDD